MNQVNNIVLFDGVCNLCNSSVQFLIKHDQKGILKYASLQSNLGKQLISQYALDSSTLDSLIFISNNKAYIESTGVLHIVKHLGFPFNMLQVFLIVPPFFRNSVYRFIAKNRYKWFGKKDYCMMPTEELRNRFLDI